MKYFLALLASAIFFSCASSVKLTAPLGDATCVQDWFNKAGAFYCASHNGTWYLLSPPIGKDSAKVSTLNVATPSDMFVVQEIPLTKTRPVGFAINQRGEFVTVQGTKIHVYGSNGDSLAAFNAAVEDSRLYSPIAADAQNRIYAASLHGIEIYSREGSILQSLATRGLALSVAVAPDQSFWCVTDANESCHLIHYAAYPSCAVIADYDRVTNPIRGIVGNKSNNYNSWRELAVTDSRIFLSHGTGADTAQCIFMLSADGSTLLNRITDTLYKKQSGVLNAHGLAASRDTLLYLDYDSGMNKWLHCVTPAAR